MMIYCHYSLLCIYFLSSASGCPWPFCNSKRQNEDNFAEPDNCNISKSHEMPNLNSVKISEYCKNPNLNSGQTSKYYNLVNLNYTNVIKVPGIDPIIMSDSLIKEWMKLLVKEHFSQFNGRDCKPDLFKFESTDYCKELQKLLIKGLPNNLRLQVWEKFIEKKVNVKVEEVYGEVCKSPTTNIKISEREIYADVLRLLGTENFNSLSDTGFRKDMFCSLKFIAHKVRNYTQGMDFLLANMILVYGDVLKALEFFINFLIQVENIYDYQGGMCNNSSLNSMMILKNHEMDNEFYKSVNTSVIETNFTMNWYFTLFQCFPQRLAIRLLDLIVIYGKDIIPVISSAFIVYCKNDILKIVKIYEIEKYIIISKYFTSLDKKLTFEEKGNENKILLNESRLFELIFELLKEYKK